MNHNPFILFFSGLLAGVTGTFGFLNWPDLDAIIMGSVSILVLIFTIWYAQQLK